MDFHRSELLQRWLEAGTFLFSLFRSHPGLLPNSSSQVWDGDMVAHTRKFTSIYRDLAPYRRFLQAEYRRSGLPPVRHGALLYPDDDTWFDSMHPWWEFDMHCPHGMEIGMQQFFLGGDLLVAPVLAPGDTNRKVYFPGGRWQHWWSNVTFEGKKLSSVDAPLDQPPVFYRRIAVGEDVQRACSSVPQVQYSRRGCLRLEFGMLVYACVLVLSSVLIIFVSGRRSACFVAK